MKYLLSILLGVALSLSATAQVDVNRLDSLFKKMDFSIPDLPAFKALDIENSKLLTPSTLREFAFAFSPFYTNGGLYFPKNFAAEASPAQMLHKLNNYYNYAEHGGTRLLLNSSLSVGTNQDSLQRTKLSIGYRGSIIRKAHDVRRNYFSLPGLKRADSVGKTAYRIRNKLAEYFNLSDALDYEQGSEESKRQMDSLVKIYQSLPSLLRHDSNLVRTLGDDAPWLLSNIKKEELTADDISHDFIKNQQQTAENAIKQHEDEFWNPTRLDWALAFTAISRDSVAQGAAFQAFDTWVTGTIRLSKWGQLLVGFNNRILGSDSAFLYDLYGNTRLVAGRNKVRAIAEAQYHQRNIGMLSSSIQLNTGAEFRLAGSLWVVALAGYQSKIEGNFISQFVSSLNLKYGIN